MQAVSQITVEGKSAVSFETGGKHLMLMQPRGDPAIDSPVTLEIHYDEDGLMIVTARMRSRSVH